MSTRRKALRRKIESINGHLEFCKKYYEEVGKEISNADVQEGMKFAYAYKAIEKMQAVNTAMLDSM